MRRLRLPARAASAVAAGAVTVASLTNVAYADGAYRHAPPDAMGDASAFDSDPDILERMARALREMKNSPLYKQASCSHFFASTRPGPTPTNAVGVVVGRVQLNQLMKKQEATRQEALQAEQVQMGINQMIRDIVSS
jgi:ATPase family AAA domain-containing protein 3A/B